MVTVVEEFKSRGGRPAGRNRLAGPGIPADTTNSPGTMMQPQFISAGFRGNENGRSVSHSVDPLNIYYDSQWSRRDGISARVFWAEEGLQQLIETRTNGTANSNVTSQTVWSAAYINAPVLQDSYAAGVIQPNSRLYFTQDANWDTTAVIDYNATSGTWGVVQRYVYSPYGTITILNADWSATPTGTMPLVNNLFQGMANDPVTGLYYERARWYSASLGTWISQDPLQYINGADTYQFVESGPVGSVDASGLAVGIQIPNPVPPNWGPVDSVTGQPYFLPSLPNGGRWVPVPNPNYDPRNPNGIPVKWVPENPIKTPKGSQPQGHWDPKEKYGTYCNGEGRKWHTSPNGEELSPGEAQRYKDMAKQGSELEEGVRQVGPGEVEANGVFKVVPDPVADASLGSIPEPPAGAIATIWGYIQQGWQALKNFISGDGPPPPIEP